MTDESGAGKGLVPHITDETEPFWTNLKRGRLVVDYCNSCGLHMFPPHRWCYRCRRADTIDPERELTGRARLYSYTVNHKPWLPGMAVPFVLGLAEFPDVPGVRIPCRIRTSDLTSLRLGLALEIGVEDGPGGFSIPSFAVVDDDF
jgi:uncharacterized OB-fold protein